MTQETPSQPVRPVLQKGATLVIKIGSAQLTDPQSGLALERIAHWADQIAALCAAGIRVVVVSSGAVAEGCVRLGLTERPRRLHRLQAAAAVGQVGLTHAYEQAFAAHKRRAAMILLTHEDLADRSRYLNARSTLTTLLSMGVVPIVNENDTVATEEIRFGDNDTLGAMVTNLLQAELLLILTDQQGLHAADPRIEPEAPLLSAVSLSDPALEDMAGARGGSLGQGGMLSFGHAVYAGVGGFACMHIMNMSEFFAMLPLPLLLLRAVRLFGQQPVVAIGFALVFALGVSSPTYPAMFPVGAILGGRQPFAGHATRQIAELLVVDPAVEQVDADDQPVGVEFGRVLAEIRMGKSRTMALEAMRERLSDDEVTAIVGSIIQGENLGTPLATVFRTQADVLRIKRTQRAETIAGEAGVKMLLPGILIMASTVVIILGPFLLSFIYQEYIF